MTDQTAADRALLDLLGLLDRRGYRFVTPTPATHARVLRRPDRRVAVDLSGMLGWSLPFERGSIDEEVERLLAAACAIEQVGAKLRSTLRVSSLHGRLFLHSAYPTIDRNAVFFGPDSYRFADLVAAELRHCPEAPARIVDIGTGAGVGAIVAAIACPDADVTGTDVNPDALRLARINAQAAGVAPTLVEGDGIGSCTEIDVAIANPPYIIDDGDRAYRDGGDMHGGRVSLEMASAAMERLRAGGRLILYTGSAIVGGRDPLKDALADAAQARGCAMAYREIDPDVFGEELEKEAYRAVDRIAVVAAICTRGG
jgi:methylase of polypeptide subunit release factors